jgi:hypothetical protein
MSHLHALRRPLGLLAFVTALSGAPSLAAQTDDQRASARALATEGASAFNDGRYKDAADLFSKAESLVHAPTHLLFLARSYAKLGQLVRAQEAYNRIVREQLPSNAPPQFNNAQKAAQEEISSVEPRIGRLTIQLKGAEDAKDLNVTVDGKPILAVMVGVPQPIDPGEHRIEATAAGKRAQAQSITLKDGERTTVTLQLQADSGAAVVPAAAAVGAAAAAAPNEPMPTSTSPASATAAPPTQDQGVQGEAGPSKVPAYVAFGVGAVGLGLGTVFTLKWASKRSEADDLCNNPDGSCPESARPKIDELDKQGTTAGTIGLIGFGVGAVGIGAGITLLVMNGGKSESKSAGITPLVGPGFVGMNGRF